MNLTNRTTAVLMTALIALALPAADAEARPATSAAPTAGMTEARFWSVLDRSRGDDRDGQLAALRLALGALSADELVRFQQALQAQMHRSYRWDLWGAAHVAMGGASDDGFHYFRLWLISRGRETFESVLSNPDALAALAPDDPGELEFEELAYLAPVIWSEKTGKPEERMPGLSGSSDAASDSGPIGDQFSEEPAALAPRYPALWKRFGGSGD
jgi:hypothetical protein